MLSPYAILKRVDQEVKDFAESDLRAIETSSTKYSVDRAIARQGLGNKLVCTHKGGNWYIIKRTMQ